VPRSAPDQESTGWPPGIPYIIGNEGAERFAFYGIRSFLTPYLAGVLYTQHPLFAADPTAYAKAHFHLFLAAVYALPMIGAVISDRLLGKYRTILWLSIVYACGSFLLALGAHSIWGVWAGLGLVALGSGGIKPCVSAHVGDQFGKSNWFRLRTIYQAFYFIINFGSFFAYLLIPWTWKALGVRVAFGIPGILMLVATIVFWMGRNVFIHVPPKPGGRLGLLDGASSIALFLAIGHLFFTKGQPWYVLLALSAGFIAAGALLFRWRQRLEPDDGFLAILSFAIGSWLRRPRGGFWVAARERFGVATVEGPIAVLRITSVFVLVSAFWALFDQKGSSLILQAQTMNLWLWDGFKVEPAQLQAANPTLVMLLIPFAGKILYPAAARLGFEPTPLRRMTAGLVLAALAFVALALIQAEIDRQGAGKVWVGWQLIVYFLITLGEVLVSITGLEFAYSQAPGRMKSTIMGFWLLAISLGNVLTSMIALARLPPLASFWTFAAIGGGGALLFAVRARFYTPRDYVQE
jgi:proton-dependent oligopeptide transporter, POT family